MEGLGAKDEGIEKYGLVVTKYDYFVTDAKYSIGNIVNHIVTTMHGISPVLEISEGTPCKAYDYLTPMLYT